MDEIKIWKSYEKKDDKIIICYNSNIYKANPPMQEIDNVATDFIKTRTTTDAFFTIPFSYVKEIRKQDKKNYIEILFGRNSSEHLKINDEKIKEEIFDFFTANIPDSLVTIEEPSISKMGKKPLIGFCVLIITFLWTYYTAEAIECNPAYYFRSPNSFFALVLGIATLGTSIVLIIFGTIFLISIMAFVSRVKRSGVTKIIRINR